MNNGPRKGTAGPVLSALRGTPSIQGVFQVHKNVREGEGANNAPDECIANLDEKCQGRHLHLSLAHDAARYTIENPSTGKTWSYTTQKR